MTPVTFRLVRNQEPESTQSITRMETRFKSDAELVSMVLDLVEAIQNLLHAVQMVRLGIDLPNESKASIDVALATSELATKSVLGEVKRFVDVQSQSRNES